MDPQRFQVMIDAWNYLFRTAKKFDADCGNLQEELTSDQLAIMQSINDQHNAWYTEQGLDTHELN